MLHNGETRQRGPGPYQGSIVCLNMTGRTKEREGVSVPVLICSPQFIIVIVHSGRYSCTLGSTAVDAILFCLYLPFYLGGGGQLSPPTGGLLLSLNFDPSLRPLVFSSFGRPFPVNNLDTLT